MKKQAIIRASALVVLCPHCEAEQPAPDNGSDQWTPDMVLANQGERTCASCDEPMNVVAHGRVNVCDP